jgi:hypothetical protein
MPTGVEIVDLADAIAADLASVNALPVAVTVSSRGGATEGASATFDPSTDLKALEAADRPTVSIVPRTEIEDVDARGADWDAAREIDIAVRFKLQSQSEVIEGIKLLKAIGRFYRNRRPTGRSEDFTLATYTTLWSPMDFKLNRIYFGVVRLSFTPEVEDDE